MYRRVLNPRGADDDIVELTPLTKSVRGGAMSIFGESNGEVEMMNNETVSNNTKKSTRVAVAIKWRVKHEQAKTVYRIQCHDVLTLTYPFGAPIHPKDADFVARAEREDVPERWTLWGRLENSNWCQSEHETKEAARAALGANRLAPPEPPVFHV
jgi:hypothetical protein